DPLRRHDRLQGVMSVLMRHGLRVVEDADATALRDVRISPAVDALIQQPPSFAKGPKPRVRQLRLQGRYPDVPVLPDELGRGDAVAIPVGLTMKEAPLTGDLREWVLLVWM